MRTRSQEMRLLCPPGRQPSAGCVRLSALVHETGGSAAAARWRASTPHAHLAHVHGERVDLWWEFQLAASFRWQGHISRLTPDFTQGRVRKLSRLLLLDPLLDQPVEALTRFERVRANLGVALLPQPELLLWEEPFCLTSPQEAGWLADVVRTLVRSEGLQVVAVASQSPGLSMLDHQPLPLLRAVR